MKTRFQNDITKSSENRQPFCESLGLFWVQFLSKKLVVCRSKTILTCGPLKIVILTPSGHSTSSKFEVISWCKFDRFWRWWGQAVHKNWCLSFWGVDVISAALLQRCWWVSASSSTFMKKSYNFLCASRSIAKTVSDQHVRACVRCVCLVRSGWNSMI